ncbi:MAG TPA: DUF4350 domain-containing protein [Flavobacteriales bacterium]|nr:DUF4350 domain-containing protein [Flavobacteriales bacterium]
MRAFLLPSFLLFSAVAAQQVPDSLFTYNAKVPAYGTQQGPVVMVDEAHHNFHHKDDRYRAFANVLEADGYRVINGSERFTADHLAQARVLVIANALGDDGPWQLPTAPAFTKEEVEVVTSWVESGGSLFLIADHMPFGGAAARLGRAFGFNWVNGYALRDDNGPEHFSLKRGNLSANPITAGSSPDERIEGIMLFTGSAFLPPPQATVITRLDEDYTILLPQQAGQFSDTTAWIEGRYFCNGAMLEHGKGRVVCFGEAAMFSAQFGGPQRMPMGMNQRGAEQNPQFLLNVIHWLDRRL